MNGIMVLLIVVLAIVFICVCWYISTSNRIKRLDIKVSEALSGIDVALTKRYDVSMPITEAVNEIVNGGRTPQETVEILMRREQRAE